MLGAPKRKKKVTTLSRDGCPQLSYTFCSDRPGPHWWENTKYNDFWPFWPRTDLGTKRNPGPGPKSEKNANCWCKGSQNKKNVTMLSGMDVRNPSNVLRFGRPEPQGWEIAKYRDFRPFWPRTAFGIEKNPGHRLETEKRDFLVLGVPKSKKKVATLSRMVVCNL